MSTQPSDAVDLLRRRRQYAEEAAWIASSSRATDLGRRARRAYLDRLQIRNLQRVAETSASPVTLLDYVKTQIGTHPLWRRENFGQILLEELERLRARADEVAADAYLELIRLYVRQLAAAYVYSIAVDAAAPRTTPPAARPAAQREATRPARQRAPRGVPARPAGEATETEPPAAATAEEEAEAAALSEGAEVDVTTASVVDADVNGEAERPPADGESAPEPTPADEEAPS